MAFLMEGGSLTTVMNQEKRNSRQHTPQKDNALCPWRCEMAPLTIQPYPPSTGVIDGAEVPRTYLAGAAIILSAAN